MSEEYANILRFALEEEQRLRNELEDNVIFRRLEAVREVIRVCQNSDPRSSKRRSRRLLGVYPSSQAYAVINGAAEYLAKVKRRRAMSKEIAAVLIEQGVTIGGKRPAAVVAACLSECKRFDNVREEGGYGLIDQTEGRREVAAAP